MASSANRITGLASGLDIDSIIQEQMKAYKTKVTKKEQERDLLTMKQEMYQDLIKSGREFYDKYFNVAKSDSLFNSNSYTSVSFKSSDESVGTATATSSATKENYSVNVTQLVKAASTSLTGLSSLTEDLQFTSGGKSVYVSKDDLAGKSDKEIASYLKKQLSSIGLTATTTDFHAGVTIETATKGSAASFSITGGSVVPDDVTGTAQTVAGNSFAITGTDSILTDTTEGKAYKFEAGDKSVIIKSSDIQGAVQSLNDSIASKTTAKTNAIASSINSSFTDSGNGFTAAVNADGKIDIKNADGTVVDTYEASDFDNLSDDISGSGYTISKSISDTATPFNQEIDQLESEKGRVAAEYINGKLSSIGLKAELNTSDGSQFVNISTTEAGGTYNFTSGIFDPEHLADGSTSVGSYNGQDLKAKFTNSKGESVDKVVNSNDVTIDGTTFSLTNTGNATFTAKSDSSGLVDKIKSFVEDYNTMIKTLNKYTTENKNRDYSVLTEDQKDEMKDSQIEKWNEKVKQGQLKDDYDIYNILSSLKSNVSTVLGSEYSLSSIGITTSKEYSTTNAGTLEIDEDKLKSAIESDTEGVMNLFLQKGDTPANQGILTRMKDVLSDNFVYSSKSPLIQKAGYEGTTYATKNTLSDQISDYNSKIKDMNSKLSDKEQDLYTKWSKVESAMNTLNNQLSTLQSYFS